MRISDWSSDVCSSDLPAHGLDDRIETFRTRHETLDTDAGQWRRKPGSLARPEAQLLPKRMGDHQYVGKQDGAVKGKTSERLKRHLGSGGAVVHKLQKSRSEEHTSALQSLLRISYAVFCLNKQKYKHKPSLT